MAKEIRSPESVATFPLYDGEGFKRKLVGWLTADGQLLTVNHRPSEDPKVPAEWNPWVEVSKQIFPNKIHERRVKAMQAVVEDAREHMALHHPEIGKGFNDDTD